ncbi:MAG: fibronectin type III domain-containing protein, partial [Bacteroidota bacterium]
MRTIVLALLLLFGAEISAQQIKVQPYLQDAEPNSILISWETNFDDESIVDWGASSALGNQTSGTFIATQGANRLHEVRLTGLNPDAVYHYRVRTNTAVSDTFHFRTPPLPASEKDRTFTIMPSFARLLP